MTPSPLRIVGSPGSPYSRKLRAVLRYRRIPHAWINQGSAESEGLPVPRVVLLPQLLVAGPDGEVAAHTDSTPLIRRLEGEYSARSVVPEDPALAFLDALVEDYADEWLTKAMFHYRWAYQADAAQAAAMLPRWGRTDQREEIAVAMGKAFAERQIGRLGVVGSSADTAAVIERSYLRLLRILDRRLTVSRFVFGSRPAAADFALFGQLTQLAAFDPTPTAIARREAPRVAAWVDVVEDLSGIEPAGDGWIDRHLAGEALGELLGEIGRVYVPFLLANADALARGADRVECTIDGHAWAQKPFPYQGKCLRWLREGYRALAAADRHGVDAALAGSGCEALFPAQEGSPA